MEDLEDFLREQGRNGETLYQNIQVNTLRYQKLLHQIVNSCEEIHRTTPLTDEEEFENNLKE